jgi:hypothetical protein
VDPARLDADRLGLDPELVELDPQRSAEHVHGRGLATAAGHQSRCAEACEERA